MAAEAYAGSMEPRRRHLLPLAGILLLGLLAYGNSLRGAFVFDDIRQIRDNPAIRDLGALLTLAGYRTLPNRFVAYVTFALNYRLGGLGVLGYHVANLAIHLAAALVLYALVITAFRAPRLAGSALAGSSRAVGFAAAVVFVTHPLQSQAVSYVVQRLTSLAALFYLVALLLYLRFRLGQEAGALELWRRRLAYGIALLAALLATRTKEIAFTLPAAALLLEAALFEGAWRRRLPPLLPFAAIALLIPATLLALGKPAGELLSDVSRVTRVQADAMTRFEYLCTEAAVVATYLRLLAWPAGLNVDHDFPTYRSLLDPPVAGALALHAGLLLLATWLWRGPGSTRRPLDPAARLAAAGILFFFLALLVESSVIPIVDVIFEHRAYLPSAGFWSAAATGAALLLRRIAPSRWPRLLAGGAAAVALVLAGATLWRNKVWRTDVALWTDAAAKSPGKMRPQLNLGTALLETGRAAAAIPHLRDAVRLAPSSAYARAQLGAALLTVGQVAEGETELRAVLRLAPDDPEALFNLATLLVRTGRAGEARALYSRFLEVAPPSYAAARRVAEQRLAR